MKAIFGSDGGGLGFFSGESTADVCGKAICIGGVEGSKLSIGCPWCCDPSWWLSLASTNGGVGVDRTSR
jgi:hypothetical protein